MSRTVCRPENRDEEDLQILEDLLLKVKFSSDMPAYSRSEIARVRSQATYLYTPQ